MNTLITTLVAEDELHSRQRLTKLIKNEKDLRLISEISNGRKALEMIRTEKPELVFLDIEMPYMNAFDVIQSLQNSYRPAIIITTAYENYAVKAFDIKVVDYLLKPYSDGRFQTALHRARAEITQNRKVKSQFEEVVSVQNRNSESLLVRDGRNSVVVSPLDINWISVSGNYVKLHIDKKCYILKRSLAGILEQLGKEKFVQTHRSTAINLSFLEKILDDKESGLSVVLKNGIKLPLSRRFQKELRLLFAK